MVVEAIAGLSAHSVEKYAMEIYATMAEIKVLEEILDGCSVIGGNDEG